MATFQNLTCIVQDRLVDTCLASFQPVANKAVMAFTTRTTFYLQSLLVLFHGSIAAGLSPPNGASPHDGEDPTMEQRREADAQKIALRRKSGMGAFNILIAMNFAMSCTSLLLAHAPRHTLDFHSALVVIYLLGLSWVTIVLVAPFYIRLKVSIHDVLLRVVVFLQGFLNFVYITTLLANARTFGPSFCCNSTAKGFVFAAFSALEGGRTAGWVMVSLVTVFYLVHATGLCDYLWRKIAGTTNEGKIGNGHVDETTGPPGSQGHSESVFDGEVDGAERSNDNSVASVAAGGSSSQVTDVFEATTTTAEPTDEEHKDSIAAGGSSSTVTEVPEANTTTAEPTDEEHKDSIAAGGSSSPVTEVPQANPTTEGPTDEELKDLIEAVGTANLKLFSVYLVIWILVVINTELLIARNGFAYDIRDNIAISFADPVGFAQTLQFTEVLTFFIPFVHVFETSQKVRATWMNLRKSRESPLTSPC